MFRAALDVAPNAMVMVDGEGIIVFLNAEAEKFFGYERREVLGQSLAILFPESFRGAHSGLLQEFANAATRPLSIPRNLTARSSTGRVFPVEIRFGLVEGAEGTWVLISIVDVSADRPEAQRLRLAVEAVPHAMVMVDHEGKIVVVNPQAQNLFGYREDELLGRAVETLIPELSLYNHPAIRRGLLAQRSDGAWFPVEIGLNPIETPQGFCMLTSITDIGIYGQRQQSIGEVAGGVAHDLNNLLGSILADTELALDEIGDGSSPLDEIHNIRTVVIRASEIVRELMVYAGQEKSQLEPVNLSSLVQEILNLLKVSVSRQVVLKTSLRQNLPAVLGNAPQLRQIAMNLILNASEAIGEKGVIRISTRRVHGGKSLAPNWSTELPQADYVKLEVSDTGRGMTDIEMGRVFEHFFTTKSAGRGLGLAVVQRIVRAHGGAIHVVSSPGQGATFQLFFPSAAARAAQQQSAAAAVPDTRASGRSRTVLLVEDERALRAPVAKMLRKHGFNVLTSAAGPDAIEMFHKHADAIDFLLLDVAIRGTSSFEILSEVRRVHPHIRVILTSTYALDMLPFPPDAPQISGFIRKPFQLADLLRLFEDLSANNVVNRAAG